MRVLPRREDSGPQLREDRRWWLGMCAAGKLRRRASVASGALDHWPSQPARPGLQQEEKRNASR